MTLGNAELYRLKSDARRGLLENDLILQRFFARYGDQLSVEDRSEEHTSELQSH